MVRLKQRRAVIKHRIKVRDHPVLDLPIEPTLKRSNLIVSFFRAIYDWFTEEMPDEQ